MEFARIDFVKLPALCEILIGGKTLIFIKGVHSNLVNFRINVG